tara:strand:- start:65 stop:268 length:204 start_codon:yes stop_codon:yes gene_type:complete
MGKTKRDRIKNQYLEDDDDYTFRKESKKRQKRNRRNIEKNLKDAVLSGAYDEYEFDEDFYSEDTWDG